jgi:hypothetical protein
MKSFRLLLTLSLVLGLSTLNVANMQAMEAQCLGCQDEDREANYQLLVAALQGDVNGIYTALVAGANIDVQSDGGNRTPLTVAIIAGKTDAAIYLINCGAKTNIKDISGNSPLTWAQRHQNERVINAINERVINAIKDPIIMVAMFPSLTDIRFFLAEKWTQFSAWLSGRPLNAAEAAV